MGIKIFLSSFTFKILLAYKALFPNAEMNVLPSFGTRSQDYYDMIFTYRHLLITAPGNLGTASNLKSILLNLF